MGDVGDTVTPMAVHTLGVLGGMGPAATADFMAKLANRTPAARDQDHFRTVVYSDPTTPDRSDAILGQGASPLPAMVDGIHFLERSGADLIAIPCNTAHYWYDQLQAVTQVPIVHMVEAVNAQIAADAPEARTVGLLATDGTVASGIYHDVLGRLGRRVLALECEDASNPIMIGMRAVKAGDLTLARKSLTTAMNDLVEMRAEGVVYGCTDVSAALDVPPEKILVHAWDSADALAANCVSRLLRAYREESVIDTSQP